MSNFKWNKPIFVLGNPRSGTSLLRLMLDTHQDICIPPESHFFLWLEEKYGDWNNNLINNYLEDLFKSTKIETWNLDKKELKKFIIDSKINNYAVLNSTVYRFYALKNNSDSLYWGDKNSLWTEKLQKINYHYPDAYYVSIVRDGRDVACSYKSLHIDENSPKYAPNLNHDIEKIAKEWSSNIDNLDSFLFDIKGENKVKVRYEDLIIEPVQTLNKVMRLLKLNLESAQLEYYKRPEKTIEPKDFLSWKQKLLKPLDKSNIGKYKLELSKKEIDVFNSVAYKSLKKNSYL